MDVHHRRPHAYARHQGLEGALILAVVVGHVGGRSTHVEGDDLIEPGLLGGFDRAHDAASRPGQDGILALEQASIRQATVGLHELQPDVTELTGHLLHVSPQDG